LGGLRLLFCGGELGPNLAQCSLDQGPPLRSAILIHPAIWPQWTWAKNWGGAGRPPPLGEGELGPHLTQYGQGRGLPTSMPSFILIHPSVWSQYTNVTDSTDRQRSDSIGRTVFSERGTLVYVSYMLSPVRLSSVTFVRRTQAVQIFGNISAALGTLVIN